LDRHSLSGSFSLLLRQTEERGEILRYAIIGQFQLDVPEPSGLALSIDKQHLWTVSDANSTVYQLSLDGKVLSSFAVEAGDLEGIAVVSDSVLCVISERAGELIFLTYQGQELERHKLEDSGGNNAGYEGLAYDRINKRFFLAKEKMPPLLIELDGNLKAISTNVLDYASDLSSLDYDHETGTLWLASDESRIVASITTDGLIMSHLPFTFPQIEGIAYDSLAKTVYLVCDKKEKLFVLKLE
jgi:uncharacterized protein YjiK